MSPENILLVSLDSVRADHLPLYGYDRPTMPHLQAIADGCLVFDDVHVPGVGTPTSFTGMFTGEHARAVQTNVTPGHWRDANAGRRFLQESLQDAGYYTGAVHANPLVGRHYGWDRGWDEFYDDQWTAAPDGDAGATWHAFKKHLLPKLRRVGLSSLAIHAKNLAFKRDAYAPWEQLWPQIEAFVRDAPEPWFLWVLLVDTHHPWIAPKPYHIWPQPGFRRMTAWNYVMRHYPEFTGERRAAIVNAYDNELRHADGFLTRLDALLAETEHADAPLIVHADHGDELGEHADYGHAPAMWDTVTRVPLVMRNVGEAGRVAGPHTLLDLGSTILDIAGADERLGGRPSLLSERPDRLAVYIENRTLDGRAMRGVAADGWKLVHEPGSGPVAYHRGEDPREQMPVEPPPWLLDAYTRLRRPDPQERTASDREGAGLTTGVEERLTELGYLE